MVQPPWLPDPEEGPLPFDQRGACWPRGPCSYQRRLQLRYDAIAYWSVGGPDLDWYAWATGQSFITQQNAQSCRHIQLDGCPRPATTSVDFIYIQTSDEWPSGWQIEIESAIETSPDMGFLVRSEFPAALCTHPVEFFPIAVFGVNPPTSIIVKPVLWYNATDYPYFG